MSEAEVIFDFNTYARELESELKEYGITEFTKVTVYKNLWRVTFDVKDGVVVRIFS